MSFAGIERKANKEEGKKSMKVEPDKGLEFISMKTTAKEAACKQKPRVRRGKKDLRLGKAHLCLGEAHLGLGEGRPLGSLTLVFSKAKNTLPRRMMSDLGQKCPLS